jgi:hypothetical protein
MSNHVVVLHPEALLVLPLNVGALLLDEGVEAPGVFHVVAPPVVVELEAGEVVAPVIDVLEVDVFVPVPADAERPENVDVRVEGHREAQHTGLNLLQGSVRPYGILQGREGSAVPHRQRREPGTPCRLRVGVLSGEGAPHRGVRGGVHELRSEDARNEDDRIPLHPVVLGGAVVELRQIRRRPAGRASPGEENTRDEQDGPGQDGGAAGTVRMGRHRAPRRAFCKTYRHVAQTPNPPSRLVPDSRWPSAGALRRVEPAFKASTSPVFQIPPP